MRNVRRHWVPGHPVFITQVCAQRAPLLHETEAKRVVVAAMNGLRADFDLTIDAYAILDDHLHVVMTPVDGDASAPMRAFKLRVLRRIDGPHRGIAGGFWQPRFYDHVCRDARDFERHVDYVHYNPVRHGYVHRAAEYAYSTLSAFIEAGTREPGWGDCEPAGLEGIGRE